MADTNVHDVGRDAERADVRRPEIVERYEQ
jgi:hypothetical protein